MDSSRRRVTVLATLLTGAAWCLACTDLGNLAGGGDADASGDGESAVSDAAASDGPSGEGGTRKCKGDKGPTPVRYGDRCIDATEVSNAQFAEFTAATGGDAGVQPAECVGASMVPGAGFWPKSDSRPVRSIGWCAARAYCAWAGKRLCGRIGGGQLVDSERVNPFANEWYAACSQGGTRKYPYGNTFDSQACQSKLLDGGPYGEVGSALGCEGPPGVFDLSGSMWEWIDQCATVALGDGGTERMCTMRGGSYAVSEGGLACSSDLTVPLLDSFSDVGIRCCSDLE